MQTWNKFRALFSEITPHYTVILVIVFLMILDGLLALLTPWIAGKFTASLLSPTPLSTLSYQHILFFWLILLAFQGLVSFGSSYISGTASQQMLARLRTKIYNHLQSLPIAFFHEQKHGRLLSLLTNDATVISNYVTDTLLSLLPQLIIILGSLFCIFTIKPVVALLSGLFIPFFYISIKLLGRRIRPFSKQIIRFYADTLSVAEENLATIPIIKSFTREQIESTRFDHNNQQLLLATCRYLGLQSFLSPAIRFFAAAIIIFVLWIISGDLSTGKLNSADLVRLILYGIMLTQPISRLANIYGQTQRTLGAAEQLFDIFSLSPEVSTGNHEIDSIRKEIIFQNISFQYPNRSPLLVNLNLRISAGETLAIIGENGAGKSTLVHLLLRFADPDEGTIFIDGRDIRTINLTSLRQQIGIVQQQVLLQNTTIADNIRFGSPLASIKQVEMAARASHSLEFIKNLPHGFDTLIGDQGVKLSGGQKQRVALARALIKDPSLLILDEATAMFDPEGERSFIHECADILRDKTVILITHRPESLMLADRILTLKNGAIHETDATAPMP